MTSLWASLLLSSAHAFAQENVTGSRGETATSAGSAASTTGEMEKAASSNAVGASDQAAALAYRKALSSYSSGDVQGAFQNMQQSYLLSGRAELLFNLACLERELQRCQAALRDYDGYLRSVPNGKFRSDAQQAKQELQRECPVEPDPKSEPAASARQPAAEPQPSVGAPATPTAQRTRDASYWTVSRKIGWSAIATGTLSGGVALYFLNAAIADHDAAAKIAAPYKYAPKDPPWLAEQEAQHRDLRAARLLGITAGALLAGGLVVLILSPKPGSSASASATLAVHPGYLGAVCSGSF